MFNLLSTQWARKTLSMAGVEAAASSAAPAARVAAASGVEATTKAAKTSTPALALQDVGYLGSMTGTAAIGGVASYTTGGEFWQGAVAGAAAGGAVRGLTRMGHGHRNALQAAAEGEGLKAGVSRAAGGFVDAMSGEGKSFRNMAAGAAGLAGGVFGGSRYRNNRRSGFNSHRGNTF